MTINKSSEPAIAQETQLGSVDHSQRGHDTWKPLRKIQSVLEQIEHSSVSYCHWKSNYHLEYAVSGSEDLDLLVNENDFPQFVQILLKHRFKQAESITSRQQPGVFHFLGNDDETGTLINIHAYTRILTGDHFLKSWTLPLEALLLSETIQTNGIRIPVKSSESIVFVLRNMIKHTSLLDLYLAVRSRHAILEEHQWIDSQTDMDEALSKLTRFFPEIKAADFKAAFRLLGVSGQLFAKIRLGFRFKKTLKKYRRYGPARKTILTYMAVYLMAVNKFILGQKHMTLSTGGKIIALVGPQATGKSTLAAAIRQWLGQELAVRSIHVGKPPASWLTIAPNQLIPVARLLLPGHKSITMEKKAEEEDNHKFSIIFLIRKLMLAHERRRLLRGAYRQSRNGKIIVADRYPSDVVGAIDGATFPDQTIAKQSSALKRLLMNWERALYREICSPDLVFQLSVPTETAVLRNSEREKNNPQTSDYVRMRHSMRYVPAFCHSPVVKLSTDCDFDETLLKVKNEIWSRL